jgi:hypothetical protein
VTLQSWAARPKGYAVHRLRETTYAARTMRWGGPIIALFVIYHLLHFTTGQLHPSPETFHATTDGMANVTASGAFDYPGGAAYALQKAQEAADRGFRIFAVSVGSEPDVAFMDQLAAIGHGQHFHAEGSIENYSAQLDSIFATLGGKRPIQLVE